MANHNDDENGWVDERLGSLEGPRGAQPDAGQARARLRERQDATGRSARRRVWMLAVAGVVLLAVLSLPWPRAAAQRLLDRLTLGHIAVIDTSRKDLPGSVTDALVMKPQPWAEERARDLDDAQRIAGFRPSLPPSDVVSGTPTLSVVRKATLATAPLKVADIERALAMAGVRNVTVPREWEGTALSAEGGPAIIAEYGDFEVIQSPPFRLTTPAGFPFGRFMELTFRVFGRPEDEARRLGQQLAENPALVMHFPGASAVRDVPLRTGTGVLVGNPDGTDGMCFFWSTPARIYIIEADQLSESRAVAVADSIQEDPGQR